MPNLVRSTTGFTFVETIIAFSIVGIFLALTWATVSFLLMKTSEEIVRTRGHFLAVEGVEQVKQIRQTMVNRNRLTGFYDSIGSKTGNYILDDDNGEFALKAGENELIEMNEDPFTAYCRTLNFEGDELDAKRLTVTVQWGDVLDCSNGNKRVVYSTYLTELSQ